MCVCVCIAGGKLNIFALRKAVGVVCLAKGASLAHSRLARGEQSQLAWPVKHFGVLLGRMLHEDKVVLQLAVVPKYCH